MVVLSDFKEFASFPRQGQKSVGLIRIDRTDPSDQTIVTLPISTYYISTGQYFRQTEQFELNESLSHIEVLVTADKLGTQGNLPAHSTWVGPFRPPISGVGTLVSGLNLSNPNSFSQGVNEFSPVDGSNQLFSMGLSDQDMQNHLDISTALIKDLMGYLKTENLPDEVRVDHAVYTLTLYNLENKSSQENQLKFSPTADNEVSYSRMSYFRDRLEGAIRKKVLNLINPYRRLEKFMPELGETEVSSD